jgi:hypothetical protein
MGQARDLLTPLGGGRVWHDVSYLLTHGGKHFVQAYAVNKQGINAGWFDDNQLGLGGVGLGLFGHGGSFGIKKPAGWRAGGIEVVAIY